MFIIQLLKIPFVQALSATIIGAFLGAWWGFLYALKKDRKAKIVHMQERQNALLQGIQNTLHNNQDYIKEIHNIIEESAVPLLNVDPLLLEQTEPLMYELEFDSPLLTSLLVVRWGLRRLQGLIEILHEKSSKESTFVALNNDEIYKRVILIILNEDDTLEKISDALALIEEQLNNT